MSASVAALIAAPVVGYLCGSANPAAIIARIRHIDLRGTGSGNPGATNAARAMGTKTGVAVGVLDVLKGFLSAVLFTLFVGQTAGDLAGFFAVLGHTTSPWLKGRGGKGVATTLGALLGTHPLWLIPVLAAFGLGFLGFRRIGLASVVAAIVLVLTALVFATDWVNTIYGVALGLLVLFRHRRNIGAFVNSLR